MRDTSKVPSEAEFSLFENRSQQRTLFQQSRHNFVSTFKCMSDTVKYKRYCTAERKPSEAFARESRLTK
ncbi:hypothetical protein Y032_0007g3276 [Ancylostoma ceylanicum]|uniref:Uncharacterized protein n=1 Tax=Ancylostoma ceylanicum TaxID=53326 RepID=A0A016VP93_9BILA|nr:hypothetical protein Y032_0007g3276 [Ancylostoma ceylanicum]